MTRRLMLAALMVIVGTANSAKAGLIFSNFGTGVGGATGIYGDNLGGGLDAASPFTPSSDALFGSVTVLADYFGGNSAFIIRLASSSSGFPGAVLETIAITLPAFNNQEPPPTTVFSSLNTPLVGGTQYWIVMTTDPSNPDGSAEWFTNPLGLPGGASTFSGRGEWYLPTNMAGPLIEVRSPDSTVPEPTTAVGLGLGIAAMVTLRRRRG